MFNARFYYPVFSILFLDFGLTLSQFAILNAVWAATIVICEVPSGALADSFGRRNLLVLAGSLMVIEIALWAFRITSYNVCYTKLLRQCPGGHFANHYGCRPNRIEDGKL